MVAGPKSGRKLAILHPLHWNIFKYRFLPNVPALISTNGSASKVILYIYLYRGKPVLSMTTILFFAVVSQVTEMLRFCRTAVELKDTLLMVKIYVSVEADPMMHVAAMINLIMFKKQLNTILRF